MVILVAREALYRHSQFDLLRMYAAYRKEGGDISKAAWVVSINAWPNFSRETQSIIPLFLGTPVFIIGETDAGESGDVVLQDMFPDTPVNVVKVVLQK